MNDASVDVLSNPQAIPPIIQPLPLILEIRRPGKNPLRPRKPASQPRKRPNLPLILDVAIIEHGAQNPRRLPVRIPKLHHLTRLNPAESKRKTSPPQPHSEPDSSASKSGYAFRHFRASAHSANVVREGKMYFMTVCFCFCVNFARRKKIEIVFYSCK